MDTLIFDLGGVVCTNDWHYDCPQKFEEYSDYFGISYEAMERGWNAFWPKFSVGKITEDTFWRGFLKTAGAKTTDVEHAKKLWRKYQAVDANMLRLLQKLKKRYRLAALTTISKEWLDFKVRKFHLNDLFEVIVSSGYSGLCKPDQRIYDLIVKKLEVNPRQCTFVDDTLQNLKPAKRIGMETILFKGQKDFERTHLRKQPTRKLQKKRRTSKVKRKRR